jgi:hypothetical protein
MTIRAGPPDVRGEDADGEPISSGTADTNAETENATRVLAFATRDVAEAVDSDPQSDATRTWNVTPDAPVPTSLAPLKFSVVTYTLCMQHAIHIKL